MPTPKIFGILGEYSQRLYLIDIFSSINAKNKLNIIKYKKESGTSKIFLVSKEKVEIK